MNKITIRIRRIITESGIRWLIENWNDYLTYLKESSLPIPSTKYSIYISHETKADLGSYIPVDFDNEIPILYRLKKEIVDIEFL